MKSYSHRNIDTLNKNSIEGSVLKNRFMIDKFIDKGSNGSVYSVTDRSNPHTPLVVKFDSEYKSLGLEIKVMRRVG